MRPSDKCPEEATRGRHLFPASVTIKAECRGFTTLRHRQNTAPSSPPLPLLCLTMRGVVVILHRGFQGCGIRLLSSFPHVTAPPTHLWAVQPLPVHPATRQITDVECEGDEKDGSGHTASGGQQQRVNIGQRRIRRVYPTHPPALLARLVQTIMPTTCCNTSPIVLSATGGGSSSNQYECGQLRCQ